MRIIAGKFKGRALKAPKDMRVRPTTDRIKETVFNMLQNDVPNARVLDLFAGSGALGIEAISRGAQEVVFVDNNRDSIALVKSNLEKIDGNFKVVQSDFLSYLYSADGKFDVVFIDAPFHGDMGVKAIKTLVERDLISERGVIYYEHDTVEPMQLNLPFNYSDKVKKMGSVSADFVRKVSVGLVTGSFDPFTVGHLAIVEAAREKFKKVVVACLVNDAKHYAFTPEERVAIAKASVGDGVEVMYSDKFAFEVAVEMCATALVRALRGKEDEAYEKEMEEFNLQRGVKTAFVEVPARVHGVSSTLVKGQLEKGDFSGIAYEAVETVKAILETHGK